MTELTVELPVKINGVIFTEKLAEKALTMQTGSFILFPDSQYNNVELTDTLLQISELNEFFIEHMVSDDDNKETGFNMLDHLVWLKQIVQSFKAPEELINELDKTI